MATSSLQKGGKAYDILQGGTRHSNRTVIRGHV